jgi:peptidoglycan hydrolase-like protein with peptidoglycan-binding domain
MGRAKRTLTFAVLAVVAAGAIAAARGFGGDGTTGQVDDAAVKTAKLARMTLVDYVDVTAAVGFGQVLTLRYVAPLVPASAPASPPAAAPNPGPSPGDPPNQSPAGRAPADDELGLITRLPSVGAIVRRGEPLFEVDQRPVVLLYGSIPMYRTLGPGDAGTDVTQLETNLQALGYTGFAVDRAFTDATAVAVRRWQASLKLSQTGTVSPGQVLYAAGAIRVAQQRVRVGDVASGDILDYTGSVRSVTASLDPSKIDTDIKPGTQVTIIADTAQTAGTVVRVGPAEPDTAGGSDAASGLQLEVSVADQKILAGRQTVTVRLVLAKRDNVLVAPIVALVALAGGGYGLQVTDGTTLRYVAVGVGLFARGFVEITSGDVGEGTSVVVP